MLLGTFQHKLSILPLRIIIVNSLQAKNPKELKALQKSWSWICSTAAPQEPQRSSLFIRSTTSERGSQTISNSLRRGRKGSSKES